MNKDELIEAIVKETEMSKAGANARPPWQDWSHLYADESERRTQA